MSGKEFYVGPLRGYIPQFITDPDYEWTYCPYCDTPPTAREHPAARYSREYANIRTCWCGAICKTVGRLSFKRDLKPWYIERLWRKQYYKHDGHGTIKEYMGGSYIGTYPVSQHLNEMMTVMPIDMGLGVRP